MRNEILAKMIVICVAIFFFLFILEILFYLFYPQITSDYQENILPTRYDPLLGWFNKQNYKNTGVLCEKKYTRTTNTQGFRDTKNYSITKKNGKKRIIVLGDSFIFGENQDDNELYTTSLQNIVGNNFEVLNFGVSGYGPDQEFLLLNKELKYQPDIVIVAFFQNDWHNMLWKLVSTESGRGFKPAFRISRNGSIILTDCCPVPTIQSKKKTVHSFLEQFHTYIFFRERWNGIKEKVYGRKKQTFFHSYHDNEESELIDYNTLNKFMTFPPADELDYKWNTNAIDSGIDLIKKTYDGFYTLSKRHNFTFVLLNIPTNIQSDPKARADFFSQFSDVTIFDFKKDRLNDILATYASQKKDLVYLDLLQTFEKEGNIPGEKSNIFYPCTRDMHWNALGAKRAAEETTKVLKEKGII